MSSCLTSDLSDHLEHLERDHAEQAHLVSAESGPRDVYATRVAVRDGRVVFEKDERMWVYRSYPIAIGPRPGAATDLRVPGWTFRATLVEPYDLKECERFKDCSAVYAIGPSVTGWWESAPFTLRQGDRIEFERLETSLLSMPFGCEAELLGEMRSEPTVGYLRDARKDHQRDPASRVKIRSALMLDPLRLAPAHVTGRRSRARGEADQDSGERWHWGIVPNLEDTLEQLLRDPELDRFRESVMNPDGDFLVRWYQSVDDLIPVPPAREEARNGPLQERWKLTSDDRHPGLIEELLRDAARYALAGPVELKGYQEKCAKWVQAQRRHALHQDGAALVFPLVQNIFVDWLHARHRRAVYTGTSKSKGAKAARTERMASAAFRREILRGRDRLAPMLAEEIGKEIAGAIDCLSPRHEARAADGGEADDEDSTPPDNAFLDGIQTMAAAIAWMEDRLLSLEQNLPLSAGERMYLRQLKAYWGSR